MQGTLFLIQGLGLLIIPIAGLGQVSRIQTKPQAEEFIAKELSYNQAYKYDSFKINAADSTFDHFKHGDFNHDGIEDLLVNGTATILIQKAPYKLKETLIVLGDKKKAKKVVFPYELDSFGGERVFYPKVLHIDQKDIIALGYNGSERDKAIHYDSVEVRNNHLFIFTRTPVKKRVTRIEFSTSHCYGTCPVFEISLDENLGVFYKGIDYVEKKGEYELKGERADWDYLSKLLANMRIERLNDSYSSAWTDMQTGFLTVTFDNGTSKSISDYGLGGTFGLRLFYNYIFELVKF